MTCSSAESVARAAPVGRPLGVERCGQRHHPTLEAAVATWVLLHAGRPHSDDTLVTVTHPDQTLRLADGGGAAPRVIGGPVVLPWAAAASHAVAVADRDGEEVVVLLPLDEGAVTPVTATNLAGEPRPEVRVEGARVEVLDGAPSAAEVQDRAALLSTAALVGAMETALRLTRDHVRTREQFGRPLARFQVVSSTLAELASDVSLAVTAVDAALEDHPDASTATFAVGVARLTALTLGSDDLWAVSTRLAGRPPSAPDPSTVLRLGHR